MRMTMLIEVINSYLKGHRRLVIPSFGAFLVKEEGVIIFTELLKGEDGVLRSLLAERGLGEIETAVTIDRFIFDIRHDLQQAGICAVADFGTFRRTADGIITFENVKPKAVAIPVEPVTPAVPVTPTAPTTSVAPAVPPQPRAPQRKAAPQKRGGGFIMWFAGIVIAGALLALGYGLYCMWAAPKDNIDAQMDAQRIPMIEIPVTEGN